MAYLQIANMKKKLLLLIDNLNIGGAEILLIGILKNLNERFEIILVTLTGECEFDYNEVQYNHRYILNKGKNVSLFDSVKGLRKIIRIHHPDIIHAHLFLSSIIARISCFSKTPVVYSLHSQLSKNVFKKKWWLILLEKITIRNNHFPLAVSDFVLNDYRKTTGYKGNAGVLRNYIDDQYFKDRLKKSKNDNGFPLKVIAVGNIKEAKNYGFLIDAFSRLKEKGTVLEIYGRKDKELSKSYLDKIRSEQLNVEFKGASVNLFEVYPKYDLFISPSMHEGFGLSVIEAMASELPVLLSDIPVYHEITMDNALFFNLAEPESLSKLIEKIQNREIELDQLREKGLEISKLYAKEHYLDKLYSTYERCLSQTK